MFNYTINFVDWNKLEETSQTAVTRIVNATTQISDHIVKTTSTDSHATAALAITNLNEISFRRTQDMITIKN